MTAAHIYDLLDEVKKPYSKEYEAKQIHRIPEMEVVENRAEWLVERVRDKTIVDIGCASGELHERLSASASMCVGIDREPCDSPTAAVYDLDEVPWARDIPFADLPVEVIVCGEVIEHLCNPGQALVRLAQQWPSAELVVTVPNAFSECARVYLSKGIENVNRDHVAWYSWFTMASLLMRSGWAVKEAYWYNGNPRTAEGLIFVCETHNG